MNNNHPEDAGASPERKLTREPRQPALRRYRFRLDDGRADQLEREAAATGQDIAGLVRRILDEHWALQEELAAPIGTVGEEKSGRIIHQLLAETEQRIAGSYEAALRRLHRRVDALFERLELVSVMVAQAYRGFLLHTPEVPLEHRDGFETSAEDRYAGYEETVARTLARGGFELAQKVDGEQPTGSSTDSSTN